MVLLNCGLNHSYNKNLVCNVRIALRNNDWILLHGGNKVSEGYVNVKRKFK